MVADLDVDSYKMPTDEQLKKMFGLKVGDRVRVKPGTIPCRADGIKPTTKARIVAIYGEGCCQLDSPLSGCRYWNETELEKID